MNRVKYLVVALPFFLISCSGKVWYNPHVSQAQADRDLRECRYEAEKYGHVPMWGSGIGAGIEEGMRKGNLLQRCMELRGYRLVKKKDIE